MNPKMIIGAVAAAIFLVAGYFLYPYVFGDSVGGIPIPVTNFPRGARVAIADELRDTLRDPYSAVFTETKTWKGDTEYGVCGRINSKNAYGSFTGESFYTIDLEYDDGDYSAFIMIGDPGEVNRLKDEVDAMSAYRGCFRRYAKIMNG